MMELPALPVMPALPAMPVLPVPAGALLDAVGIAVVAVVLLLNSWTAILLIRAVPELWRQWDLADEPALAAVLASQALPTVSVVVVGQTDAGATIAALHSLLSLRYPRHEVVLVHDAAASGCLPALREAFDLYEVPPAVLVNVPTGAVRGYFRSRRQGKLFVIDKAHAGRADDLNAALNASRFPYVLALDVRTSLDVDALERLMQPFLLGQRVAAVAGSARIASSRRAAGAAAAEPRVPTAWLPGVQAAARLRDAVFVPLGWNTLGGQLQRDGGVVLHRRDHLLEIDGYRSGARDEELDLVIRLRRHLRAQRQSEAVPAVPDVVAWTTAPDSPRAIVRQHARIHRGRLDALRVGGRSLLRARQGAVRLLAPAYLAATTLLAPAAELAGYLVLAIVLAVRGPGDPFVARFAMAAFGYGLLLTLWAIILYAMTARRTPSAGDLARLCLFAVGEQVGYRQLLLWARLRATASALRDWRGGRVPLAAPAAEDALPAADRAATR